MFRFLLLSLAFTGNLFGQRSHTQDNPIHQLLKKYPQHFGHLLDHPDKYELQIIYTQINRNAANEPSFQTYSYHLNEARYFYPASTVKMPVAVLALEKLRDLQIIGLDKDCEMSTLAAREPQTAVLSDSSSANHKASIAHYIHKIFTVSDNDAFNRLYEFLGQAYLNRQLREKGFEHTRIIHRLGAGEFGPIDNQFTNPVSFYRGDTLLYHQGEVRSRIAYQLPLQGEERGKGFYRDDTLRQGPFDFSQKNFISLQDLHDMLQVVLFPDVVPVKRRFRLATEDYRFLYRSMSMKPRESKFPMYNKPDGYVKFFKYGGSAERIPAQIRIFNKVGWAYEFLTDVSYVVDYDKQIEFMLAAVIHVNEDQIYNDDQYEYESIGLPFFIHFGNAVYEYELQRSRVHIPDLSRFLFSYD